MALELLLLCALIFIFIVSFCGLLQKIKQSYDRERIIAENNKIIRRTWTRFNEKEPNFPQMNNKRITRRQAAQRNSSDSLAEVYVNSAYLPDIRNDSAGVFPAAPPPYTQDYVDAPPKYEDIIKTEALEIPEAVVSHPTRTAVSDRPTVHTFPPPYTIST